MIYIGFWILRMGFLLICSSTHRHSWFTPFLAIRLSVKALFISSLIFGQLHVARFGSWWVCIGGLWFVVCIGGLWGGHNKAEASEDKKGPHINSKRICINLSTRTHVGAFTVSPAQPTSTKPLTLEMRWGRYQAGQVHWPPHNKRIKVRREDD